jgi:hypothetical protein
MHELRAVADRTGWFTAGCACGAVAHTALRRLQGQYRPADDSSNPDWTAAIDNFYNLRALLRSEALKSTLDDALSSAGFTLLDPIGEQFDPTMHRAVDTKSTSDHDKDGMVHETLAPGLYWRDRRLRDAEVIVLECQ